MCNSWGDPHVNGFDGQNDVYDVNWYTLVEPTLEAQENDTVPYYRVSQRTYNVKHVAYIDIGPTVEKGRTNIDLVGSVEKVKMDLRHMICELMPVVTENSN